MATKVGVVLSSGGVRGVYGHTGFLQTLQKLNLEIAACSGSSAGAFVGGIIASGTPLERWSDSLQRIRPHDFWRPDSPAKIFYNAMIRQGKGYTGLSDPRAAIALAERNLTATTFEQCVFPFYAVALNINRVEKVVFDSGELAPRMIASSAMPVLYRPVVLDGEYYCDGALVDLAPIDAICCKHQIDVIIVHHCARPMNDAEKFKQRLKKPWPIMEIVDRLIYRHDPWYLTGEPLAEHECPGGCGAKIIVVAPELDEIDWPRTEGGDVVQQAARRQAASLLQDYFSG